jgi:preprotein translocase subunit SecE
MNTATTEEKVYRFDTIKWVVVILLVAAGVYGNSFFSSESILYRFIALLVLAAIALVIAVNTAKGAATFDLIRGALVEWRKVVFPTRQEINQTTLLVFGVVAVTALILGVLDAIFRFLASLIIG